MLDNGSKYRGWPSIEKMVYKIAHKVNSRVMAAQLTHRLSVDDLIQVGALTWMVACEKFDPNKGVMFSTYLHQALFTNMNREVNKNGNIKHGVNAYMSSIDQTIGNDDESDRTMLDTLVGFTTYEPDILLEMEDDIKARLDTLSPKARIIYKLILSPPDWLVEEYVAAKEQARLRREMKIRPGGNAPADIVVISAIANKLWDIDDAEFRLIKTEIWRVQYGAA